MMDKNSELNDFQFPLLSSDNVSCCVKRDIRNISISNIVFFFSQEEQSSHDAKPKKSSQPASFFGLALRIGILSLTTAFTLMFWQFSQFVMFTQFGIISFLYLCNQLSEYFMFVFTLCQWVSF